MIFKLLFLNIMIIKKLNNNSIINKIIITTKKYKAQNKYPLKMNKNLCLPINNKEINCKKMSHKQHLKRIIPNSN